MISSVGRSIDRSRRSVRRRAGVRLRRRRMGYGGRRREATGGGGDVGASDAGRETARAPEGARPRVVVVGGGFAGLYAARGLRNAAVDLTIVDRRNFHLFQPLAYQVATGALSPAEIAAPLRSVFKRQANARVLLAEVTGFDLDARTLALRHPTTGDEFQPLSYDTLIVAGGSRYSYFGHDEWRPYAPELKSLEGALDIRNRISARSRRPRRRAMRPFGAAGSPSSSSARDRPVSRWRARSPSWRAVRSARIFARSTRAPRACCSSRPPTAC